MKDTLTTALSALRLTQLQACRDGERVPDVAAGDALDDLEEQAEAFDRMLDDIGEQVTGPLDLDGWIAE